MACPLNSIRYNGSLCACPPGYLLTRPSNNCSLFTANSSITSESGVDYFSISFPETIFAFDSIKKFTQSQAVFLEATLVLLLSWLFLCFLLRFTSLGDGSTLWFNIRWWISRLDICFATRHWLVSPPSPPPAARGGALSISSPVSFTCFTSNPTIIRTHLFPSPFRFLAWVAVNCQA